MEEAVYTTPVGGAAMVDRFSLPLIDMLLLAACALAAWWACSPASSSSPAQVVLPTGLWFQFMAPTVAEAAEVHH